MDPWGYRHEGLCSGVVSISGIMCTFHSMYLGLFLGLFEQSSSDG
jgi:hypothetical protein